MSSCSYSTALAPGPHFFSRKDYEWIVFVFPKEDFESPWLQGSWFHLKRGLINFSAPLGPQAQFQTISFEFPLDIAQGFQITWGWGTEALYESILWWIPYLILKIAYGLGSKSPGLVPKDFQRIRLMFPKILYGVALRSTRHPCRRFDMNSFSYPKDFRWP